MCSTKMRRPFRTWETNRTHNRATEAGIREKKWNKPSMNSKFKCRRVRRESRNKLGASEGDLSTNHNGRGGPFQLTGGRRPSRIVVEQALRQGSLQLGCRWGRWGCEGEEQRKVESSSGRAPAERKETPGEEKKRDQEE